MTTKKGLVLTADGAQIVAEIHQLHQFAAAFSEQAQLHLGALLYSLRKEFPDNASYANYCAAEFGMAKKTALDHAGKFAGLRANPALTKIAEQSPHKAIALTSELTRRRETLPDDVDEPTIAKLLALPPADMVKSLDRLLKSSPAPERTERPVNTDPAAAPEETADRDAAAVGLAFQKAITAATQDIADAEGGMLWPENQFSPARKKKILHAIDNLTAYLDSIAGQLSEG